MGLHWVLGGTRPLPTPGPHLRPQKAQKIPTNASVSGREPLGEGASFEKLTAHWPVAGDSWERAGEHDGRKAGEHARRRPGSMLGEGQGACWERVGEHAGRRPGNMLGEGRGACWERIRGHAGIGQVCVLGEGRGTCWERAQGQVALTCQRSSTEGFLRAGLEAPMATCPPRPVMGGVSKPVAETACLALGDRSPLGPQFSHLQSGGLKNTEVPSGPLAFGRQSLILAQSGWGVKLGLKIASALGSLAVDTVVI